MDPEGGQAESLLEKRFIITTYITELSAIGKKMHNI